MSALGTRSRPAVVTDSPKPYPVLSGACTKRGISANAANIAKPMRKVATFVASTARRRSSRRSTSGSGRPARRAARFASTASPAASMPSVLGELQPHEFPSVTPISSAMRPRLRSGGTEPVDLRAGNARGGRDDGDGAGERRRRDKSPLQNSQGTPACSTITPAIGSPMPPPTPNTALIRPMAPATRARGKVSRMIPKARGKMPPATPCTARPAITQPIDGASAHMIAPSASIARTTGSTRSFP